MTDAELNQLIEPILKQRLAPFGFERSEVAEGHDHDDERALFVAAHYGRDAEVPTGDAMLEAAGEVQHALQARGDERFPYIRHLIPDPARADPVA